MSEQKKRYRQDTIFAPSSAIGGAIVVIRVSGDEAEKVMQVVTPNVSRTPGRLRYAVIRDGEELIDDVMAVYFPAPNTYTGENMVEINCHGGARTVQRILGMLSALGLRPAEGGEFTRRAFLNGKMDLSEAEAVMDIITAGAEQSRKAAIRQLHGSVSREIGLVENELLDALSGIDAAIDYPDEAEDDAYAALPQQLGRAKAHITKLLEDGRRNRVLRDGLSVVILGRPNTGKSSLLNAMLGRERAIVTSVAGTTRDTLEECMSVRGIPVRVTDTAGIRETDDPVERIGVDRAREALETADLVLVLLDGSRPLTQEDAALLAETAQRPRIVIKNKSDLAAAWQTEACGLPAGEKLLPVSAKTEQGLDALYDAVAELAGPLGDDAVCVTNERHLNLLEQALSSLRQSEETVELDCMATDIQNALHSLGGITGTAVDDAVIDRVFSRFCVGK